MPDIKDTVGPESKNYSDVALVQAMLKLVKNAKGHSYLHGAYDGVYGKDTKQAITDFQKDNKLKDDPGLIKAASESWKKLVASLPADGKEVTIIQGTKTVYLPATDKDLEAALKQLQGAELDPPFQRNVRELVQRMYERHKIALKCSDSGMRRDFAWQDRINKLGNGPPAGESNHQYGKAVDIGFGGFQWIDGNGHVKTDTFWLNFGEDPKAHKAAYLSAAKQAELWAARNAIAFKELGMQPTSRQADLIHVQDYSDTFVDYGRSLAALLTNVGSTKWEYVPGHVPRRYKCDFGLGGDLFSVGSGKGVYEGHAQISKADLSKALKASTADLTKIAPFKNFQFVKHALQAAVKADKNPLATPVFGKAVSEKDIHDSDLELIRKALRSDYDAADRNWKKWKIVR